MADQINKPQYAILHHTADPSQQPQLEKVNQYHKEKFGMQSQTGFWVGYHYFIERDGKTIQTRLDEEEGVHTIGRNFESLGICLAGNFDIQIPSEAQLNALFKLLQGLAVKYNKPEIPLFYHFRFANKSCPGGWFQGRDWQILFLQNKITILKYIVIWLKSLLGLK